MQESRFTGLRFNFETTSIKIIFSIIFSKDGFIKDLIFFAYLILKNGDKLHKKQ